MEYDIEGEKVIIKQYVVTDTGIDFKICQDDESKIKICGCELKTKNGESYDEMVVRLKDYYIVSNVIKDSRWTEEDESTINILYLKEGQEDVYTAEKKVKLDTSDVYYNKTIQGKPLIISDDKYNVSRIILATWYMKIDYDVDEQMSGDYVPIIKQGGEELLAYLTAVENKGGCSAYYQHPEVDKPIEIALGKFDYEKNTIDEMSEYMKIELKNILKEDR